MGGIKRFQQPVLPLDKFLLQQAAIIPTFILAILFVYEMPFCNFYLNVHYVEFLQAKIGR
jgi:hypothetical protein